MLSETHFTTMFRLIVVVVSLLICTINAELAPKYDLDRALAEANKLANLVYQRFEYHHKERYQFFIESMNIPDYAWDLMKYRIASKILMNSDQEYLMIFGGSSVTAGHDNYYHQSYPLVLQRRMEPVFEALGMKLHVRNIAQGANNCRPFDYCYEAMGGSNPDFISWEQSFNCGRSRDIPELMARFAYWNKAIVFYVASGAFLTNNCAKSTDKLYWTHEKWTPEAANITSKYEIKKEELLPFKTLMNDWYNDGNSVSRFTNQIFGGLYKGVGPHGYSVWGHSSKLCNNGKGCTAIDVKGDCFERGGPHWMVAETSYYAGEENAHGKNWHPPAGLHLMRAEVIAYNYMHIVADAIYMIKEDLANNQMTPEAAIEKYQKAWEALYLAIPERALHLSPEESQKPFKCYTNYEPHFNPPFLLSNLVLGKHPGWTLNTKDGPGADTSKFGHKDRRPSFESAREKGLAIHFRIPNVHSGAIRVCGHDGKESLKNSAFYLDPNYTFPDGVKNADFEYKPSEKRYELTKHIYVNDECTRLPDIPIGGDHVLSVVNNVDGAASVVSHVITF